MNNPKFLNLNKIWMADDEEIKRRAYNDPDITVEDKSVEDLRLELLKQAITVNQTVFESLERKKND